MTQKAWRMLFMVYANKKDDDKVAKQLSDFLKSLLDAKISESNSYLLLINIVKDGDYSQNCKLDRSVFFEIKEIKGRKNVLRKACDVLYTPGLYYKLEDLTEQLKKVFETRPAKQTMLITWDHGAFFGMYRTETIFIDTEQFVSTIGNSATQHSFAKEKVTFIKSGRRQRIYNRQGDVSISRFVQSGRWKKNIVSPLKIKTNNSFKKYLEEFGLLNNRQNPYDVYDTLSNEELGILIKRVFVCVDIVVMLNCYMQNLHTSYALKDVASILIAAQGDMEMPGYDFKVLLAYIDNKSKLLLNQISKKTIRSTAIMCANQPCADTHIKYMVSDVLSLFAVRPIYSSKLADMIDYIASYFLFHLCTNHAEKLRSILIAARRKCMEFETIKEYSGVDLRIWLIEVKRLSTEIKGLVPAINTMISKLHKILSTYIIYSHRGVHFTKYYYQNPTLVNVPPAAVAIYFPYDVDIIDWHNNYEIAVQTHLMQNTIWMAFLKKLYPGAIR
jgi:hypothetical protein